ncbi:hypothetical protein CSF_1152 [Campylobacter sputorum bv. faecalis CCUG 20703]|nr:hypothetical protein CSF_1152 [Campylobacter sputorum bv. faecalis CCUG 20703]
MMDKILSSIEKKPNIDVCEKGKVKIDSEILGKMKSPLPGLIWKDVNPNATTMGFLPKEGGAWGGKEGDSIWKPDPDVIPKKGNPNGETWREILAEYGIDGIEFKDGEPDFSPVAEATVEIDDFSVNRSDNFNQADETLADKWSKEQKDGKIWTPEEVAQYRKDNQLSWHERSDQKTLDLVPQKIHGNIPHSGGISEAKKAQTNTGEAK